MEGPSPDIGGRKAKVSPSLTAALQGRPQSFLLPLTPGFHRDQKSGCFGIGGEANSWCWRPRGIMAGPHPRWERERGSQQDHHRGDRRRRFLAGDLWTNMDSGNFEGPVRFEAGPPIWSIRDTRVADGYCFDGSPWTALLSTTGKRDSESFTPHLGHGGMSGVVFFTPGKNSGNWSGSIPSLGWSM